MGNYGRPAIKGSDSLKQTTEQTTALVSIITPAYNAEHFIADTILSVQAQTYPHWEMLIVDDCSTDKTIEIVEQYEKNDSRIKLFRLPENSGPATARNTAMDHASGRFFAFLDGDDQWLPQKLEKQVAFMEQNHIAFSFTKYRTMTEDGTDMNRVVGVPEQVDYQETLRYNVIGCLTVMIDAEQVGPVRMVNMRSRQDYVFWLTILKKGFIAYGLPEVLAKYRVVGNSVSSNKWKMARQNWKVYRKIEKQSLVKSLWYLSNYIYHSLKKYVFKGNSTV